MHRCHNKYPRLIVFGGLILSAGANAADIRVDPNSPTNGTGGSWATAHHSLASAITQAGSGDRVLVADATYKPANQSSSFTMKQGVLILGGYAGYGAADPDARNPDPLTNGCILSGDLNSNNAANSGDCRHVVTAPATGTMTDQNTSLDGFTIKWGYADSGAPVAFGGGILLQNSPLIRGCIITDNYAESGGGGIYIDENTSPVIRNSTVSDNTVGSGA